MVRHPIWLSLAFFCYSVFVAMQGQWQAGDIVWSMWIASLIGGYTYIVLSILAGAKANTKSLGKSLFLLFFFTAHFGGFHFVHGQIMQGFFPLGEGDIGFVDCITLTLREYWQFVLVALANLWPQFSGLFRQTEEERRLELEYQSVKESMSGLEQDEDVSRQAADLHAPIQQEPRKKHFKFDEPYRAVVRNHVMIFIVAFFDQIVTQPQLLYLLLIFYFFPFSDLLALFKKGKKA